MTTATLPISELDRRAAAVHATLDLLRFEVERDAIFVGGCYYHMVGKREVKKLERALQACWGDLRIEQLREVAGILGDASAIAMPYIADGHTLIPLMRWFEKKTFSADRRERLSALVDGPRLSSAQSRHAMIAKVLFRPVQRDPVESLPDPDYGF